MKKTLLVSLAVVLAVGSTQAYGQKVSGGIKANANVSNFIRSDLDNLDNPMRFGASFGGFLKWDITEHFALQPEVMFYYKASKFEGSGNAALANKSYESWGMEIPIYAVGQTRIGNGRGYFGIGPYIGVGFKSTASPGHHDLYKENKQTGKSDLQRWDFGAAAMVGYEFNCGLGINAGYQIGFIDALDAGRKNATMLPQTVSLGLAYRF